MTNMLSEIWNLSDFAPMGFIPATVKITVYDSSQVRIPAAAFQEFIKEIGAGNLRLSIGRVFKLDEIVEAYKLMESNRAKREDFGGHLISY